MARLDLRNVTIVVNDWGGPNGLVMATEMPDRFARLIILNTWLHHDGHKYTQALRDWNVRYSDLVVVLIRFGAARNQARASSTTTRMRPR